MFTWKGIDSHHCYRKPHRDRFGRGHVIMRRMILCTAPQHHKQLPACQSDPLWRAKERLKPVAFIYERRPRSPIIRSFHNHKSRRHSVFIATVVGVENVASGWLSLDLRRSHFMFRSERRCTPH